MNRQVNSDKLHISVTAQAKKARVDIIGYIGGWTTYAEGVRVQVKDLVDSGITHAHLYISSVGGDVFEAEEIINVLGQFKTVTGEAGAVVASAASRIVMMCSSFSMPRNSLMMVHRPEASAWGNITKVQSAVKALELIDANYLALYRAKAADPDGFETEWNKSTDIWYSAKEALEIGFATAVTNDIPLEEKDTQAIAACGYKGEIGNPAPTDDLSRKFVNLKRFFK